MTSDTMKKERKHWRFVSTFYLFQLKYAHSLNNFCRCRFENKIDLPHQSSCSIDAGVVVDSKSFCSFLWMVITIKMSVAIFEKYG